MMMLILPILYYIPAYMFSSGIIVVSLLHDKQILLLKTLLAECWATQ